MEDLHFGYVKILSGVSGGRIGRYTSDERDSEKAKVYFGYHMDTLTFQNFRNCKKVARCNITNDISKRDLVDRYYAIAHDLESIDLNNHKKIKKHSAEHTDIITECNLIRGLLRERFSPAAVDSANAGKNVLLLFSFMDALWVNDFSMGLEEKGYNVIWDDHESWQADRGAFLKNSLDICYHFILVASIHSIKDSWLKEEHSYLKSNCNSGSHQIICVKADDAHVPASMEEVYDLQDQFSEDYNRNLDSMTETMDF